ncbi:MAG: AraC family transcriptional regulator [Myxococcota bacterium]|nr:AraC family transcriptional regulator [Myxococcota bacterium]
MSGELHSDGILRVQAEASVQTEELSPASIHATRSAGSALLLKYFERRELSEGGELDLDGGLTEDSLHIQLNPLEWRALAVEGRWVEGGLPPLLMGIHPAEAPLKFHWRGRTQSGHVHFHPGVLGRLAEQVSGTDPARVRLHQIACFEDAPLAAGLMALRRETLEGGGGELYADTLAHALALHLLENHATLPVKSPRPIRGRLDLRRLRIAIDYLQTHLSEPVPLSALAEAVGLSPFHFARGFKKATGRPPHSYLTELRLERARELLATGMPLSELALCCGFGDQSHLTRVFSREVGMPPGRFRRSQGKRSSNPPQAPVRPSEE